MTKKYNSPMLQIVSIKHNDIVTTSETMGKNGNYGTGEGIILGGADRFREFEDYSY